MHSILNSFCRPCAYIPGYNQAHTSGYFMGGCHVLRDLKAQKRINCICIKENLRAAGTWGRGGKIAGHCPLKISPASVKWGVDPPACLCNTRSISTGPPEFCRLQQPCRKPSSKFRFSVRDYFLIRTKFCRDTSVLCGHILQISLTTQ